MQNFIEYLEELIDFKRNCSIKFRGDNGGIAMIQTRLLDIHMDGKGGYIQTDGGIRIDISQLIEVNGRLAQNIC